MNYADLEICLHNKWKDDTYSIELRYVDSRSDSDNRLPGDNIKFDFERLRALAWAQDHAGYGRNLGQSLFSNAEVKAFFVAARDKAAVLEVPLRLRLAIGQSATGLHSLRWETLRDPQNDTSLVTDQRILFSRYLSSLDWRSVRPRNDDLRALVVIANPTNLEAWQVGEPDQRRVLRPIDVPGELGRARSGLSTATITELATQGTATLDSLYDHLREGYDILYLVCHGALVKGKTRLWLENEHGGVANVDGSELITRLRELQHQPRLVVLASCQSAGDGEDARISDEGALAALGPRLAEAGIPAVLAMQGNITMDTVKVFMPVFFEELKKDGQIDRAIAIARGAVRDRHDSWMPVLFMRLRSGKIWFSQGLEPEPTGFSKWPSLLQHIAEGNCTPVLGFGMIEYLLGSPRDIARHWADTYDFPMVPDDREDLPQVAQYLAVNQDPAFPGGDLKRYLTRTILHHLDRHGLGEDKTRSLDELMVEAAEFQRRQAGALEPHATLASLPFRVYVTTNADSLMSDALINVAGKNPQVRFFNWQREGDEATPDMAGEAAVELEKLDRSRRPIFGRQPALGRPPELRPLVYHLFGYLDEPQSLVLTEDNYFDYLIAWSVNRSLIPPVVSSALADSALLFLGFRLDDWNFRVLFRSIMRLQGSGRRRNYTNVAVQIDPDQDHIVDPGMARRYLEGYFQNANISLYWGSLEQFLRDLASRWKAEQP